TLRPLLQINSLYHFDSGPWRSFFLGQYNRSDFGPVINIEEGYEGNGGIGMTEAKFRQQHYVILLSGATGDMSGVEGIWNFTSNWQSLLTSEGGTEMSYFVNFAKSIPWQNLTPDQSGTVFQSIGNPTDYSGAFAGNTLAIAYKPSTGAGSQA